MVCAVCLSVFLWICNLTGLLRGASLSMWYLPRIWPSVTDMQHNYDARYPSDNWHLAYMFSLAYCSVEACLEGVFPHSVSTRRDPCVRIYAAVPHAGSPSHENTKQNRTGGDPAFQWNQARGHLNWRMGLPSLLAGNLGRRVVLFSLILHSLWGCFIGRIHYCFHYHHYARLIFRFRSWSNGVRCMSLCILIHIYMCVNISVLSNELNIFMLFPAKIKRFEYYAL